MKSSAKKNVALIFLGTSRKEYKFLPGFMYAPSPGIFYIGEYLKNYGYNVSYINQVLENLTLLDIEKRIKQTENDIYLFSQFYNTRNKIKRVASTIDPRCIIGIGGHDATFHSQFLKYGNEPLQSQINVGAINELDNNSYVDKFNNYYNHADFIWQGEAEYGFAEYLNIIKKRKSPLLINNLNNTIKDLDTLPILKHDMYDGEIGFLVTSRGCLKQGCEFCTTPQFYPDGWRARSIKHVEEELINIKRSMKKFVYIFDDNFFGLTEKSLERGINIINICSSLGLKCMAMTSVHQILRAESKNYLKDIKGTLVKILLGVENLDCSSLKKLGKRYGTFDYHSHSIQAINALLNNGIYPYLGYINFHPYITLEEFKNSVRFLYQNNNMAAFFNNIYNQIIIFEGTPIFKKYLKNNIIKYCDETGEIIYSFDNEEMSNIRIILDLLLYKYREMDYLDNEAMKILYMNQLQESDCGKKCSQLRKEINEFNYNLIMQITKNISTLDSVIPISSLLEYFNNNITLLIDRYKDILQLLIKNSDFLLKEPIAYI